MSDSDRRIRLQNLFVEHAAAVRAYARRRIDPATADDTVSEVFVVAWRRLDDVPPDALPWLLACARRILANQHRAVRRRLALGIRLRDAAATRPRGSIVHCGDTVLAQALAELSSTDREVLLLTVWENLEPDRAAAVMGCSRRTLAVRLHRARRRLTTALERLECDDDPSLPAIEVPR